ncbi:MAG TPA: AtpZ/AtpI family protein [Acidimicrobiales bacterium]|nr:AtpZ/AtpI family protein [Acidimicrobiales bacterium]
MEVHDKSAEVLGSRARNLVEYLAVRDTYRGYGNTMAQAFELVMLPFLFGLAGWGIDHALGASPIFMLALGLLAVVGVFVRAWYRYDDDMRAHEASLPYASTPAEPHLSDPVEPPA